MTKKKIKAAAIDVPATREEAEQVLADIGRLQRTIGTIQNRMNDVLARVKARYESQAKEPAAELERQFARLHAWAEAHRAELLVDGSKTARLATGELSWRTSPPSVRITDAESVIERLKEKGLHRFVRTKEEVNRELILATPETVSNVTGISITQREEFIAKPFEEQIQKLEPAKTEIRGAP